MNFVQIGFRLTSCGIQLQDISGVYRVVSQAFFVVFANLKSTFDAAFREYGSNACVLRNMLYEIRELGEHKW